MPLAMAHWQMGVGHWGDGTVRQDKQAHTHTCTYRNVQYHPKVPRKPDTCFINLGISCHTGQDISFIVRDDCRRQRKVP